MKSIKAVVVAATVMSLSACATTDGSSNPNKNAMIGAGVGAVLGGVLGNQVSHASGAPIVGAVVGAMAGGAVGNYMDKKKKEMEQQLATEAANNELFITTMSDGSLRVGLASDVSFDLGSATLRPDAMDTYTKIANILKADNGTVIHVVGHTDTTGSDSFNNSLSMERSLAVGRVLAQNGFPGARIKNEGRGERELVVRTADNVREARNRRVDIVIKPVVQGNEQAAWAPPPYLGS